MAPGVRGFPVRSPTLPPATHTNVWILGHDALTVIDPASPWPEEQQALERALASLDRPIERILLTHHHRDHVSGAVALQQAVKAPIAAHPETAARVGFPVQHEVPDVLDCGGLVCDVHFTPGHAPGHLALVDRQSGSCVAGDLVAGVGTIAIDPDDAGHLGTYLASLAFLRTLATQRLLPAHGPVLEDPEAILAYYLAHRHSRTQQIHAALQRPSTPLDLAPTVYPDLDPRLHPLAAVQIRAHLIWLLEAGQVSLEQGRWQRADGAAAEHP